MADWSGSARFQTLFESALDAYEKKTGVTLAEHPLAVQLQSCHSVEDITTLLHRQAQAFSDFRENDRIMKSIRTTVSILTPLSGAASVARTLFSPAKAIQAVLGILLDTANGVISSCDVLADLLESIEHIVNRLSIYAQISHTPAIHGIVVNLIAELISTLALATQKLKQRRSLKMVKNYFGVKDIKAARQRLEQLMQEEARTTAAQTLGLVDGFVRQFIDDGKASTGGVRKVPDQMTSDMYKSKRDKLRSDIRSWLSPPDPREYYNIARGSRHRETGAWFVNGNTLSEWKASGQSSLLWLHGKPGAGKTVLCSTIIEDLEAMRQSGLVSLAMFYYSWGEDQKKDLHGLLSSVLFQLCDQSNPYCDTLFTFYTTHRQGAQSPSDDELVLCLKDLLNLPGQTPVYLFIDGLDECPSTSALSSPREGVLSLLEDLIESQFTNLRICVTSRTEADIEAILEPLTFRSVSLHDERGQKEDIKNYIESVVNTNRNMKNWNLEHKQLVIDTLTKRVDGMFRWVHCQLEFLADCMPAQIRQTLDKLPPTLYGTYERTLRGIKDTKWEYARRLLQCVAVASRHLRVEELAEILAFDFEAGPIPKFREDWRLNNPVEAVLSTCSTLLSLVNVGNSQVIQFAHFSVKEFLMSTHLAEKRDMISHRYHISMLPAHTLVAQVCLGILLHLDKTVSRDAVENFPLARYAAEHWFTHARFEGVSQNVDDGMKQLFDRRKPHLAVWLWICDPTVPSWNRRKLDARPLPPSGTPLHYAAFCGLHDVVNALAIEHSQDVNSRSFTGASTPLYLASGEGHVEVSRILLKHGADAGAQNDHGSTPLHQASEWGHVELARVLIEHHAHTAAQDDRGWTPLRLASERGDVELARLLIEHGADAAAQDEDGWTPLHLASERGEAELARLLVEHDADVAAQDEDGWTPLHLASYWGHLEIAQLLVEHDANPSAQDNGGWTPLHRACKRGEVELARLLIERGADTAAQDDRGWTPLHLVSERGDMELARLLVKHGADIAAKDRGGRTPLYLYLASKRDNVDLARLLEHGADAAAQESRK